MSDCPDLPTTPGSEIDKFVAYVERKWGGGTGHTPNNRWVSHAQLRKHAEAFIEQQAIYRQADEQCAFDPAQPQISCPTGAGETEGDKDVTQHRTHPENSRQTPQGSAGTGVRGGADVPDRSGLDPARGLTAHAGGVSEAGCLSTDLGTPPSTNHDQWSETGRTLFCPNERVWTTRSDDDLSCDACGADVPDRPSGASDRGGAE
jgi:hypothetical protein